LAGTKLTCQVIRRVTHAADTAYGIGRLLAWLLDRDITPHIPVWDRAKTEDGMFTREDFRFDRERNVYVCPNGAELTHSGIGSQREAFSRVGPNFALLPVELANAPK
jgi:hypothetical protein